MKKSLYNITQQQLEIIEQIESQDGLLSDDVEKMLEITKNELETKSMAYVSIIKDRQSFINQIDNELNRLQGLKKSNKNLMDRLRYSLLQAVQVFGEFRVGTLTFKIRKSKRLIVDTEKENNIPAKFFKKTVVVKLDKAALKKEIKNGLEIDGVSIDEFDNLMLK